MSSDEVDLRALSLLAFLGYAGDSLDAGEQVDYQGSLFGAYLEVTSDFYDDDQFDRASATLARAAHFAADDPGMLGMLGEGPIRSWLSASGRRALAWALHHADAAEPWRTALASVSLEYRPEFDAELRALGRHVRAIWDLPPAPRD